MNNTNLTQLSIAGKVINDILPGIFEYMSSLELLDLSDNKTDHLNSAVFSGLGAFSGLTNLERLSMKANEITDILPGTFENTSSLEYLVLSYNEISEIMSGTFENLSSLEYLDLGYNKIKHLNIAVFSGLGTFNGLTNLERLSMTGKEITEILPGTFEYMSSLERLDLSVNNLRLLDSAVFSGFVN